MSNMEIINRYAETVKQLLKAQNEFAALSVFKISNLHFFINSHDNWNGGIDFYTVQIYVSPAEFVNLQKQTTVENIESIIAAAFNAATNGDESIDINTITIIPKAELENSDSNAIISDEFSFWHLGYYRVFISHLTEDKASAANLKSSLSHYGISCFVAHEDIEPTKLWEIEIENGLRTMQCLCAIITPKFINSRWCDQEVGYALGRNIFVIPIRKGCDPYGLMGKIQGVQSKNKNANELAEEIFQILSSNTRSNKTYIRTLAELFLNSKNRNEALKWIQLLNAIKFIDSEIVGFIHDKCLENENIKDDDVIELTNKLFVKYSLNPVKAKLIIESNVEIDDLPF